MSQPIPPGLGAQQPQPEIDEFEIMRRRVQQQGQRQRERAQRQTKQQFARLGTLPSGQAIAAEQRAVGEAERLTGQALQDVNIAQAQQQFQQREAEAGRELQRLGIRTQAETARLGETAATERLRIAESGLQSRLGQQIQGAQSLEELRQAGASSLQQAQFVHTAAEQAAQNAFSEDMLGQQQAFQALQAGFDREQQQFLQAQDLETKKDLTQMQIDFDKISLGQQMDQFKQSLQFQQLDSTQKNAIAQAQVNMQAMANNLKQQMFDHAKSLENQELAINKMVTAVNMVEPLRAAGLSPQEIATSLEALDLGPDSDQIIGVLNSRDTIQQGIDQLNRNEINFEQFQRDWLQAAGVLDDEVVGGR